MTEKLFTEISPFDITDNPCTAFSKEWALLAAGDKEKATMMTIAWAGLGVLWNRNVVFVFVRPQRYTYIYMEKEPVFSVGFFPEEHRDALKLCGALSGHKKDKVKESGLTLRRHNTVPYFAESRLTLICRKLYFQDLEPKNFIDASIDGNYPSKDYHRMYVGEIETVLAAR